MGSQALLVNQLARARLRERLAWHNTKPRSGARARGVRRVPGVPIWDSAWLGDVGSVGGHQLLQGGTRSEVAQGQAGTVCGKD